MNGIRVVSTYHLLSGLVLILFTAPRPFGAFEPYFDLLHPLWVGVIFVFAGGFPLIALHIRAFRCLSCAVAPQQIILFYGTGTTALEVVNGFDPNDSRSLLALCYLAPMTAWHFLEGIELAAHVWAGRHGDGRDD